eukprot:CAMPEP_0119306550 /NCGR_PEP_ID=MMETSP1333-20130426/7278_1 /TAXON_ID=418940 /ORGANISM="Scyphosphaera apsteinii, Strain RCC1455" /LENGTH=251 /DNA_ID=CAMNT_0007309871 /DNA_START=384 /DNA_END=1136 /DNA_ORIENTATION=-
MKWPTTPSTHNCSWLSDDRDDTVGGCSAVCLPVYGDHLSEKFDHGRKTCCTSSEGADSSVKLALNERNWQRYKSYLESQKATWKRVTLPPALRRPSSSPAVLETLGKQACVSGDSVSAIVKPGAFSDGTILHCPDQFPIVVPDGRVRSVQLEKERPPITGSFSTFHVCIDGFRINSVSGMGLSLLPRHAALHVPEPQQCLSSSGNRQQQSQSQSPATVSAKITSRDASILCDAAAGLLSRERVLAHRPNLG